MRLVFAPLVAAAASAASFFELYSPVPHVGYMYKKCVHSLPAGAQVARDATGATVTHSTGSFRIPLCDGRVRGAWPMTIASEAEFKALQQAEHPPQTQQRELQLPADYNGWLEYANTTHFTSGGYSSFLGTFSVPSDPLVAPQELYLFTGLQNIGAGLSCLLGIFSHWCTVRRGGASLPCPLVQTGFPRSTRSRCGRAAPAEIASFVTHSVPFCRACSRPPLTLFNPSCSSPAISETTGR